MKRSKTILLILLLLIFCHAYSQPYVDIANLNYQRFSSDYKDNTAKNNVDVYALNLLLPKQFKNGNALLFRISSEMMRSERTDAIHSSNLSGFALAIGYQWVSESQKWKTTVFAIPKVASDFKDPVSEKDWQYGGLFLEEYKFSPTLQLKFGLFANREAFGPFFVPLLGIDWKATDRIYCYGVLPAMYKFEFNAVKNKLYTGVHFKTQTHSFHIAAPTEAYIRFDEIVVRGFVDYHIFKNMAVTAEAGCSIGKNPLQYYSGSDRQSYVDPIYTPSKTGLVFTVGMAYRIRNDFGK